MGALAQPVKGNRFYSVQVLEKLDFIENFVTPDRSDLGRTKELMNMTVATATASGLGKSKSETGFPSQIKYIVGNEACERFSYYGMRAILVVFMTDYLMKAPHDAKATYHFFAQAVYFLPLLGAFMADRLFGKYRTIMWLSIVYCLGHLTLALFENETGLLWGLALIALGSGGIKPCVSAFVGDQFTTSNKHLIDKVFSIFYFSINFGAFFSSLLTPLLLTKYGPSVAFGIPGILMALATLIFWLGRKQYIDVPPTGANAKGGFVQVAMAALRNWGTKKGESWLDNARGKFTAEEVEGAKAAWNIFKVFLTVTVFWALFDQQGSSWTLQAKQMDRLFLGVEWEASQIQAANPIMVMVLIPLFSWVIYPGVARLGIQVTPLRKMGVGMILAGLSFAIVGFAQTLIDAGHTVSIAWQMVAYLVITASEVMVSITGLEFAYTQAPKSMKSTIMSFWLLTVAFGNMLVGITAKLNVFTGAGEFYFYGGLMAAVSVIFVISAMRYQGKEYVNA
jgi:POT family proton-dependent oligopeptide transporter